MPISLPHRLSGAKKCRIFLSEVFSSSSLSPSQPTWHIQIGTTSYLSSLSAAQMSFTFLCEDLSLKMLGLSHFSQLKKKNARQLTLLMTLLIGIIKDISASWLLFSLLSGAILIAVLI